MLKKVNYIFTKRQKRNMLILSIILFFGSLMEVVGVSAVLPLVTIITDESVLRTEKLYIWIGKVFGLQSLREFVFCFTIFLMGIYLFKNLYIIFQNSVQYRFVFNNQRRLSTKMMDCYLRQDYLYHLSKNVADLQRNISNDVNSFYTVVLAITQFESEFLVCIMLVLFLLFKSFSFTISIVIMLGCSFLVFIHLYRKYSVKFGNVFRKLSGQQNKWIIQAFTGIKEIKVMNKEDYFLKKYDVSYREAITARRKHIMLGAVSKPIIETISICGVLAVIAAQTYFGTEMKSLVPLLSVFAVSIFRMLPSFNRLSEYINTISFGKAAVDNIYQDLKEVEELLKKEASIKEEEYTFNLDKKIELKNITFRYPGTDKAVVKDVSMEIWPNKSIALIGSSGAGKTTLADIILGILIPQRGQIEVAGENVFEHVKSWHENIGYIPQMIYLMDDSVKNNVAFGIPEKEIEDSKVWEALHEAQLDGFVKSLPKGLDTQIGDRGVKLSGGQRQRIGIARALYTQPRLLILDEATSALDNDTETAVMEAIDNLHGSRTMIIIAHRLTTIRNCDFIYEVCGQGVHLRTKEEVLR